MSRIIFATGNAHKLEEIRAILAQSGLEIVSMKDAGVDVEIIEDGDSFEANALIKARTVCRASGEAAMADDSGLVIDYLGGEPGIYSARYLGEETPHSLKNQDLLRRLEGVRDEERTARFVCAVACVFPDGRELCVTETMEGRIAHAVAGEHGFGYDPIFFLPQYGCTSAELAPEQKNAISHRGKALRSMKNLLLTR